MSPREVQAGPELHYLKDLWDESVASTLDGPETLRYRSNLLGADLRITNFGGGNTSSKLKQRDPLEDRDVEVLWVKGSGGDLGSAQRNGFATLYLQKLRGLERIYRGVEYEDEMVDRYPLIRFGVNPRAPSIDTPLHGFLPFAHVDHLHPDWATALAAAANGRERLEEYNRRFGLHLLWLPWQRPGFELAMMLKRAVEANPSANGAVLGCHGLFTWGDTQRECYLSSIRVIDQFGQFVQEHVERTGENLFGGSLHSTRSDSREIVQEIFPFLRGCVSSHERVIGSFSDLPEVQRFVNSRDAQRLAYLGTSCPDHFVRTKIRPLFVAWEPAHDSATALREILARSLAEYRREYEQYYRGFARPDSPGMRNPNPTVVLVPGVGMFTFGKSKKEARLTGEFYVNAIHVMEGATALESGPPPQILPQSGNAAPTEAFDVYHNYVALPPKEAFGIEYWPLEEAKLRRQPPEKELSRKVAFIAGAGNGIGQEAALLAAKRGAHVVAADLDLQAAETVVREMVESDGRDAAVSTALDIRDRASVSLALAKAVEAFGGIDILVNTAALFPASADGRVTDEQWRQTLEINVTGNHLLTSEAEKIFSAQGLSGAIVLTSSANAVVAKRGSEAYDVSKAAVSHLVRELAVRLAPRVRVNAICPATVVKGSTMFPRERVLASLSKYGIEHNAEESTEELRNRLARFYAQRTLTGASIDPADCAEAILFLAGECSRCTTGHLFPVDGGLVEAFLR
jgi:rhamnose utilization protein RhaD (predicted bifunctional aldolase and dehydrogenase)/NAD(P)-dependent dehydrogenase (short-subunit alcohol dehydrogenase family)